MKGTAALVPELDLACSRLLQRSKAWETASHITSFADLGHPAPLLHDALAAGQHKLLPAFAKLQPQAGISFLWAVTVHRSYARYPGLTQAQEEQIFALSPSYGLPTEALIRLHQVGSTIIAAHSVALLWTRILHRRFIADVQTVLWLCACRFVRSRRS